MTPTEQRLALWRNGFQPLPLMHKNPDINGKGWQVKRQETNAEEITLWESLWPYSVNTGILTRKTPSFDLDILDETAVEAVEKLLRDEFEGFGKFITRIGLYPKRAVLFRTNKPFGKILTKIKPPEDTDPRQKVEVLADGQQIVAFGIHPDTKENYRWIGGNPATTAWSELPELTEEHAKDLVERIEDLLTAEHKWTRSHKQTSTDGETDHTSLDRSMAITEILAGQNLHDNTTRLAASDIAMEWSQQATLRHVRELMNQIEIKDERWQERYDDLPRSVQSAWEKFHKPETPPPPDEPEFTATDLETKSFPDVQTIVPGIFVEGLTLFAAKPKTGKSWLMLHAAIATANFGHTLGLDQCDGGDALYCALEDNQRRLQSRIRKLNSGWPSRLFMRTSMPRLAQGGLKIIENWIAKTTDPRLIIIDTLELVRERPKNGDSSYASDYSSTLALREIANKFHLAIVAVHHLRKMDAEDPFDTVSGTLGLTGAVDAIIVLTREAGTFTLRGKGRDLEEFERPISFDKETCLWNLGTDLTIPKDRWAGKKSLTILRRCLMNTLADHGTTITPWPDLTVRAVTQETVRMEFYKTHAAPEATDKRTKQDTRSKAFRRAVSDAIDHELIGSREIDDVVYLWLARPGHEPGPGHPDNTTGRLSEI